MSDESGSIGCTRSTGLEVCTCFERDPRYLRLQILRLRRELARLETLMAEVTADD